MNKLSPAKTRLRPALLALMLGTSSLAAMAATAPKSLKGLYFTNKDWELACDNTGSCRAAGYQPDDGSAEPISVLLTRLAGPGQPVTAALMLGDAGDDTQSNRLGGKATLALRIDGREYGTLPWVAGSASTLNADQVTALLAALTRRSRIEFEGKGLRWQLSGDGATSALLKMDEFQSRLGTRNALVNKGAQAESSVPAATPTPVVQAAALVAPRRGDERFVEQSRAALLDALRASLKANDYCDDLDPDAEKPPVLSMTRLSATQLLISTSCWSAAYNAGDGYWVVEEAPPFHPVLVTTSASESKDGVVYASMKGRGVGDCWSSEAWAWDGQRFIQTGSSTTGLCRGVTAGGAWDLPTVVTDLRPAPKP